MTTPLSPEDRLRRGERLSDLVAAGITRETVMAVLAEHGWDLDDHGRLPYRFRITTPPGLRNLPSGSLNVRSEAEREPPKPRKRVPKTRATTGSQSESGRKTVTREAPVLSAQPDSAPKNRRGGPRGVGSRGMVREHGSRKGYMQHYRLRDFPVDDACKNEWNQTTAARRRDRKNGES
jgi:hypothetical protein